MAEQMDGVDIKLIQTNNGLHYINAKKWDEHTIDDLKTINKESLFGGGDIELATQEYVNQKVAGGIRFGGIEIELPWEGEISESGYEEYLSEAHNNGYKHGDIIIVAPKTVDQDGDLLLDPSSEYILVGYEKNLENGEIEKRYHWELLGETTVVDKRITDEITRATNAEKTLTTNLKNEINRAKGEEGRLNNRIDAIKENYVPYYKSFFEGNEDSSEESDITITSEYVWPGVYSDVYSQSTIYLGGDEKGRLINLSATDEDDEGNSQHYELTISAFDGVKVNGSDVITKGNASENGVLVVDENSIANKSEITIGTFEIKNDKPYNYTLEGFYGDSDGNGIIIEASYDGEPSQLVTVYPYEYSEGDETDWCYKFIVTSEHDSTIPNHVYIPSALIDGDYKSEYYSLLKFNEDVSETFSIYTSHDAQNLLSNAKIIRSVPFSLKHTSKALLNGVPVATVDMLSAAVTVDSALSTTSVNPVQNKVITNEINQLRSDVEGEYLKKAITADGDAEIIFDSYRFDISLKGGESVLSYCIEDRDAEGEKTYLTLDGKKIATVEYRLEYTAYESLSSIQPCEINYSNHEYNDETGEGVFIYNEAPTSIENDTFSGCEWLTSVTIPDSVTSIGEYAFYECASLTSITIPDSVTSIGDWAFRNCTSLTSVTIGNSVTSIGEEAFYDCSSLTSVTIPDSVTSIGVSAFNGCTSLTSIIIPDSVTSIGEGAFNRCDFLTSVTIGNGVTSIGNVTFAYCHMLTSVTIGNSVTSIGEGAFEGCNVTSFYIRGKNVPYVSGSLFYDGNVSKIYVPINSLDAYKSATKWSYYADIMVGVVFEDENLVSGQNIKTINGKSILGNGDIKPTTIVEITYDELKSLRDNSKLVPGQQYRITDYITTTSQKYTYSAEHQFDIIVTALNENTLLEEAKAIQHEGDDYFANSNLSAWKIWYCLDNDTNRFSWAGKQRNEVGYESCNIDTSRCVLTIPSNDPEDDGKRELKNMVRAVGTIIGDPTTNGWYDTNKNEIFSHYSYEEDNNGIMQLTLHARQVDGDLDGDYTIGGFGSPYHYNGTIEIEGNEYSVWREYGGGGNYADYGDSGEAIYLLTDKITKGKIKIFDEFIDETIYINPKGVIYRMIDEWNNDCPYDFKNIMFNRIVTHNGCLATGSEFEGYNNVFCYTFGFYDGDTYVDASVFGNTTGDSKGVYNNIIKTFNSLEYGENDDSILDSGSDSGTDDYISQQYIQQSLNNIVFMMNILNYEYYTCRNNIFGEGCHSNTFGNYCHDNTFGNYCHDNTFGDNCDSNTFGNYCEDNTFVENCGSNTFGDYCHDNTFGDSCAYNTFGCNFYSNTFGNDCYDNTFGNNCESNIFGNSFWNNTFGNDCNSNIFGNSCYNNTFEDDYSNNIISDEYRNNHVLKSDIISAGDITAVDINVNGINAESIFSKGTINSDSNITSKGNITATGTMTSAGFYQSSDERLKTFTSDYDINLDDIKNIKTGKFYWNSDESQVINGGVSAQTVEEYFPELVKEDETGMKSVNYDGLAVVAIAAIKKLTERIEQLEEIVRNK